MIARDNSSASRLADEVATSVASRMRLVLRVSQINLVYVISSLLHLFNINVRWINFFYHFPHENS